MKFIDTHTHIYLPEFDEDRSLLIERAAQVQVETLLLPNIDLASIVMMDRVKKQFPEHLHRMMGLHPSAVGASFLEDLAFMEQLIKKHPSNYIAIGEIGLDLFWDAQNLDNQIEALELQLGWADRFNKPFVIHCRNAFPELFAVFQNALKPEMTGVLHCFTGDASDAKKALDLGLYLGIGGVLTYKNSNLFEVLKHVPLAKLVLETDAPYLSPVPFRGRRNEPAYLIHTAQRLADVYGCTVELVAEVTTANAKKLFEL